MAVMQIGPVRVIVCHRLVVVLVRMVFVVYMILVVVVVM
jgi:hypothetical protein